MADAEKNDMQADDYGNDIAVIGMAGRFPGARDLRDFWRNLRDGVESLTTFSEAELERSPLVPEELWRHPRFVPVGSVLEGADDFDYGFFDVALREAQWMDPQQRVFLQCAWAALEDAAYDPTRYKGRISLYAGAGSSGHLLSLLSEAKKDPGAGLGLDLATSGPESLAMKASFKLQLRGESMAVYTACSTGLVALHMACQSLLTRQSDIALSGAVRISSPQRTGYVYQEGLIYAPDGHCRAFDAKAAGTVPGNGAGVVVLKPLADALRDGDRVYAVIKGSSINNDGQQKVGYTAPSIEGQTEVIADALAYADLGGDDISYVEAHGTGTSLGDPIEIAALTRAFRKTTDRQGFCGIGSVKTNMGHLDAAAGVAGFMKVVLALQNEELPPSLHFEKPNPELGLERSPFYVNTALKPWPRGETPRRAGVSSFGIGGTNAHMVVEEAPVLDPSGPSKRPQHLVTLSARTPTALETMSRDLAAHLDAGGAGQGLSLADVAFTRNVGRRAFEHRRVVVASNTAELVEKLRKPASAGALHKLRRVAFLFPGQGAQAVGMGRELYAAEAVFRKDVDAALARLEPALAAEVRLLALTPEGQEEAAAKKLADPRVALPALFIVEHALAKQWMAWGVKPHAMLGHSYGEYVAACVSGVLSPEDALRLAVVRGALMGRLPPGAMLAVGLEEAAVLPLLGDELALAAINGPDRCIVSGPVEAIERLQASLSAKGVGVVRLPAAHAFHSSAVEPLMPELARAVATLKLNPPKIPYVSSLTGTWIRAEDVTDPNYWARQMRQPVRFAPGLEVLIGEGCSILLEVGPGQDLSSLCRARVREDKRLVSAPSLRRRPKEGDYRGMLQSAGELWCAGLDVALDQFHTGEKRRRVALPTYPFEEKPCRLEVSAPLTLPAVTASSAPAPVAGVPSATFVPTGVRAMVATPASGAAPSGQVPLNEIQQGVMNIWRERLGPVEIGLNDDFLELGGNSLMAAQMLTRLRETFNVQLPLNALFEEPTVAGIAARIEAMLGTSGARTGSSAADAFVRIDRNGELPLSVVQERVWRMDQLDPGNPALNMPLAVRITGALDIGVLERSVNEVIRRHEMLRATYVVGDGRMRQRFAPEVRIQVQVSDLRSFSGDREAESLRLALEDANKPFDLTNGPIVRVQLVRMADTDQLLLLNVHHIAADTLSLVAFFRETVVNYQAFLEGKPAPLPELAIHYVDAAAWERRSLAEGSLAQQETYWREVLADLPGPLELPSDRPRKAEQRLRGARFPVTLSREASHALRTISQREGVTPFMTLLATLSALLSRYSGRDDIVVGTPVGNRARGELEPLIGFVAHALALRTDLSGDPTFRELVARARETTVGASDHQDVPFEYMLSRVAGRDPARMRLADAAIILHTHAATSMPSIAGLEMKLVEVPDTPAQFGTTLGELTLLLIEGAEGFAGVIEYATDLYDPPRIARMAGHLQTVLLAGLENPEVRLSRLPLATVEELKLAPLPVEDVGPGLLSRLTARVDGSPDAVALSAGDRRLTWRELAARARGLATRLRREGVGPEVPVAVRVEPSIEAVIALWGVLEAGGACLSVSEGDLAALASLFPEKGPKLLLVARPLELKLSGGVRVLTLDAEAAESGGVPTDAVPAERLAFIVPAPQALGGRGRAMLTHGNVAHLLASLDARAGGGEAEVWFAAGGPSADPAGLDLLWALARGMRVVLPPERLAARFAVVGRRAQAHRPIEFSLSYFANDEDSLGADKYEQLLEGAKFADTHGFSAIWTPERRFHAFGGLYPSPAVVSSALAMITKRLKIRAGSVVLPLHDPIEVAEQWSIVDNLSNGRVGLSLATGWHANDFSLAPQNYARRKEVLLERLEELRTLWRGGTVRRRNGSGNEVDLALRPKPKQAELPVWLTAANNPETFRQAGKVGAGILTIVSGIGSQLEELRAKVAMYREAWLQEGHGPGRGHVTLTTHAYLGRDMAEVRKIVREPLMSYFRSSVDIFSNLMASQGLQVDVRGLTEQDLEALLAQAFEHYITQGGGLIGTMEDGLRIVEQVRSMDVDEIACLVDFGVPLAPTLESFERLDALRQRVQAPPPVLEPSLLEGEGGLGELLDLVRIEGVTTLRIAPSQARALAEVPGAAESLGNVRRLVLGGEVLAPEVASALGQAYPAASERVELEASAVGAAWPVPGAGAPVRLLDAAGQAVPVGVVGEIAVGGAAVPRGFWHDAEATRARFVTVESTGERLFLTGQRARFRVAGELERVAPVKAAKPRRPAPKSQAPAPKAPVAPAAAPRVESATASPVVRVSREKPLPLSFPQQRLWALNQIDPSGVAYNNVVTLRLSGSMDMAILEAALNGVVHRHEVLRTTFMLTDDGARQTVVPSMPLVMRRLTASGETDAEREADALRLAKAEAVGLFDLTRGPLLRAALISLGETEYLLQLTIHHIVSDGWSSGVLYRELVANYEAIASGQTAKLPELPVQYADYAVWQRGWLGSPAMEAQLGYWKKQLSGAQVLELPTDHPRPARWTGRGGRIQVNVPRPLVDKLWAVGRRAGATPFMVLMAAWQSLLHRYSGQDDILVGTPIAGRSRPELEVLIGCFLNTLAIRGDFSDGPAFTDLLRRVKASAIAAYSHQDVPFERLVDELKVPRDPSRLPLVQTMLNLHNTPPIEVFTPGLGVKVLELDMGVTKVDLSVELREAPDGLHGGLEYAADLFELSTVERLWDNFLQLLEGIAADPSKRVSELPLLSGAERARTLQAWNHTEADYPRGTTIADVFAAEAAKRPDAIALEFGDEKLTYAELDARSNQLAHYLRLLGVGPETNVALCIERSLELVVALLAIVKAGGVYVPLDAAYPRERLEDMVAQSRPRLLVTTVEVSVRLGGLDVPEVVLEDVADVVAGQPTDAPAHGAGADNLAYIDFTSGTTGGPKGVCCTHNGVLRTVRGVDYAHLEGETFLLIAPITFDASTLEVWGPLLNGGRLVVYPPSPPGDVQELARVLKHHGVTLLHLTAGLFSQMVDANLDGLRGVKQLLTGGDVVSAPHVRKVLRELGIPVTACYGPTEGTLFTSCWRMQVEAQVGAAVPIGRPIGNTQVYVLNKAMQPAPAGVVGELFLGGEGVTRGYLGQPALTAERFIPNPFSTVPGARLYRTGDLVRWRGDGVLEFLGRGDTQVKVRGFRIELNEVESALLAHSDVREAVVVARQDTPGVKRLVGYVVGPRPDALPALRDFVAQRLPDYMVPTALVHLQALPLTANGKVDRKALPAPEERPELPQALVEPRTPAEALLADIWRQVLGLKAVGVEDNFFALGGDSILAIQIVSRAKQAGLRIEPAMLFERQTIAQLAAVAGEVRATASEQGVVEGSAPLTPIQRGFFEQALARPHHFNMAVVLEVRRPVDAAKLEQALKALVTHHDALRLRFTKTAAGWTQTFAGVPEHVAVRRVDLSSVPEAEQARALEDAATALHQSLDLGEGLLLRAALVDRGAGRTARLLLAVHHLAVDGVSLQPLLEDVETAYALAERGEAVVLPPKTTSLKTWAERLAAHAGSEALGRELAVWKQVGDVPALPVDLAGGANTQGSEQVVTVTLGEPETRALLAEVPVAYRARIDDVLLAAVARAVAPWAGGRRVRLDMEGHGREALFDDVDLSRTVGWFTSLFPLEVELPEAGSAGDGLRAVRDARRRLPANGIGYGLLRYLREDSARVLKAQPRAEVSFNYLGQIDAAARGSERFALTDAQGGAWRDPEGRRPYILEVSAVVSDGKLKVSWAYSANVHRRATVESLAARFTEALRELMDGRGSADAARRSPGDFPLAKLTQASLDRLLRQHSDLEDVYPLTSLQQGMFFHALMVGRNSGVFHDVLAWTSRGRVDLSALRRAWAEVVSRNAILRTSFAHEGLAEPLQVVHATVELPWTEHDLRGLSPEAQRARVEEIVREDRARGFDLTKAPVSRMAVARLGEDEYRFLWSHHHILLDGWGMGLVLQQVFACYEAFSAGRQPTLPRPPAWKDYITWLQRQDFSRAEAYWRKELAGFAEPTPLPAANPVAPGTEAPVTGEEKLHLSAETVAALQAFARKHQLTLNTLAQGAWALLLSRYSGDEDVVFGATVSGRPVDLSGAEGMVGLFINSLPVRVRLSESEAVVPWLQRIQAGQLELRKYEHSPLVDVKAWSELPRGVPLFDSVVVFENYPLDTTLTDRIPGVEVRDVTSTEQANSPLMLYVVPGEGLRLSLVYAPVYFSEETVTRLMGHLRTLLEGLIAGAERLADVPMLRAGEQPVQPTRAGRKSAASQGNAAVYVAPATPEELALAGIWTELLGQPRIGARDDFFALGGHERMAEQLASRVRETLGVELPRNAVFESTTLAGMAEVVSRLAGSMKRMSTEALPGGTRELDPAALEQLSDEELDALLDATEAEG